MIIKDTSYSVNFFTDIRPVKGVGTVPGSSKAKAAGACGAERCRTDTIQLTPQRPNSDNAVLEEVRKEIMSDVNRNADSKTLRDLKEQVASGRYTVDADALARILSE